MELGLREKRCSCSVPEAVLGHQPQSRLPASMHTLVGNINSESVELTIKEIADAGAKTRACSAPAGEHFLARA